MKIDANPYQNPVKPETDRNGDASGSDQSGFSDMIEKAVSSVNDSIIKSQELSKHMAAGEPVDVAQTMIALSKADISFRLMVQVRNKALSAYEEIMRMQV